MGSGAAPRRHTAVTAVLGGALHDQIRRSERRAAGGGAKGDVDVEVLLCGAEKLCGVYPLPGALERIPSQRSKHADIRSTLAYYENKVAGQAEELARLNKDHWRDDDDDDDQVAGATGGEADIATEEDLRREEEEVRELDKKKRELQARLRAMEKDLSGLLHM
ncbi:DASH complex subunit Spc34 [Microdochium nivale]|nr:DASH complex subunit Spc34 [Microdochium nivale]